jgi:hypothetical protein
MGGAKRGESLGRYAIGRSTGTRMGTSGRCGRSCLYAVSLSAGGVGGLPWCPCAQVPRHTRHDRSPTRNGLAECAGDHLMSQEAECRGQRLIRLLASSGPRLQRPRSCPGTRITSKLIVHRSQPASQSRRCPWARNALLAAPKARSTSQQSGRPANSRVRSRRSHTGLPQTSATMR